MSADILALVMGFLYPAFQRDRSPEWKIAGSDFPVIELYVHHLFPFRTPH